MKLLKIILLTLICVSQTLLAEQIEGKVVNVIDGDTIVVLTREHVAIKIRLAEIDAPEQKQYWGNKSKQALKALIATQQIVVYSGGEDRYGRTLGTLFFNEININKLMVQTGNAWAYTSYVTDPEYIKLQAQAKKNGLGLWSTSQHKTIPPWKWRRKFTKK